MKINKLNYEHFVIDYIEDQLDGPTKEAFQQFLQKHPEVKKEISAFLDAPVMIEDTSVTYENKEALLKPESNAFRFWPLFLIAALLVAGALLLITADSNEPASKETPTIESQPETFFAEQPAIKEEEEVLVEETQTEIVNEISTKDANQADESMRTSIASSKPKVIVKENTTTSEKDIINDIANSEAEVADVKEAQEIQIAMNETTEEIFASINEETELESIGALHLPNAVNHSTDVVYDSGLTMRIVSTPKVEIEEENENWKELFRPRSYEEVDLKEAIALSNDDNKIIDKKLINTLIPSHLTN